MDSSPRSSRIICFGPFELDTAAHLLREEGQVRRLAAQPFRLLVLLTERAGHIVSRQEIQQCLWGDRKFVEVDRRINFCMNQIRSALRDPADSARFIKTLPRYGYRFEAPVTLAVNAELSEIVPLKVPAATHTARGIALSAFLAAVALLAGDVDLGSRVAAALQKSTLVMAEFSNATGDAVFDDTLEQALSVELQGSPVLEVLAESKVRKTLQLMRRSDALRVTPDVARELCLRAGSDALVQGSISRLGDRYVLNLRATACGSGNVLAYEQREVARQEDVLGALSQAAAHVRTGLGESLRSVKKFDVPSDETTTSLAALQSYSQGIRILKEEGEVPSIPFFRRALELDPMFAMAYASLAARYNNLGQPGEALTYAAKAYSLRDRVSENERLIISSRYLRLTGEIEKMTQVLNMWIAEFPNAGSPHGSLGVNYMMLGQFSKAVPELREALRLSPDTVTCYENLASLYLDLNQPSAARETLQAAQGRGLDSGELRRAYYDLAFIDNDEAAMQRQVEWAAAKPSAEYLLLAAQADTEAWYGRLAAARAMSRRAVDAATRSGFPESAALWQAVAALREAEFGEKKQAVDDANSALTLAAGRNVEEVAALAFARAGDVTKANAMIAQMETQYARDTMATVYRLPVIKAAVALSQGRPRRALELLEPVRPYDLARPAPGLVLMYPGYLRGQAYLALGDRLAAALEFEHVVQQPGLTLNFAVGVLARLQLARTYLALGDTSRSNAAYQNLAALWKQSDAEILALL